jgi:hypothetical protein
MSVRTRVANVHAEHHGKDLRCYDWVAPASADPYVVAIKAETALGCKLHHRGDGEQHGYVNTSRLPDGSLHVCVVLYEDCDDPDCAGGHRGVVHARHPDPSPAHLKKMAEAVGEHAHHDVTKAAHRDRLGIT